MSNNRVNNIRLESFVNTKVKNKIMRNVSMTGMNAICLLYYTRNTHNIDVLLMIVPRFYLAYVYTYLITYTEQTVK